MDNCQHFFIRHLMYADAPAALVVCTRCGYQYYDAPCSICEDRATHNFEVGYRMPVTLCDGCFFKYQVMKAAGREWEFIGECRIPRYERMYQPFSGSY